MAKKQAAKRKIPRSNTEQLITPQIANEMLSKIGPQRPFDPNQGEWVKKQMEEDNWYDIGQPLRFDWDGNLIDGQHTLYGIRESGKSFKLTIALGLDPRSIHVIDTGKSRSVRDALCIAGITRYAQMAPLVSFIVKFNMKVNLEGGLKRRGIKPTNIQCLDFAKEHLKLLTKACAVAYDKTYTVPIPNQVLGGVFFLIASKKGNQGKALEFFAKLKEGIDLKPLDPIHVLRDKIWTETNENLRFSNFHKVLLILKTWNMFIQDEQCKRLKYNKKEELPPIMS